MVYKNTKSIREETLTNLYYYTLVIIFQTEEDAEGIVAGVKVCLVRKNFFNSSQELSGNNDIWKFIELPFKSKMDESSFL